MRLVFVISSLCCGGTERVAAVLANQMTALGHDIRILTLDATGESFTPLAKGVRVVPLGIAGASTSVARAALANFGRVSALRSALAGQRPEAAIGFMDSTNVLTLLAARALGLPVVVSEHSSPERNPLGGTWRLLRRATYGWAARIVVQTSEARAFFPASQQGRIEVLPNPVSLEQGEDESPMQPQPRPFLMGLGRLAPEKGFDLLIRAFARIARRHPEWSLRILGEGPERQTLQTLIEKEGLSQRVSLPGRTARPFDQLRQASLFVLSSRFEGFANALAEALACGVPCVAADCPHGPRHILTHGVDGLLVQPEDDEALAQALDSLMSDPAQLAQMAQRTRGAAQRFDPEMVTRRWLQILATII